MLLFCTLPISLRAQSSIYGTPKHLAVFKTALRHIYNFDQKQTLRLIDSLERACPQHPASRLLTVLQLYWSEGLISKESKHYAEFLRVSKQTATQAHQLWIEQQLPEYLLIEIVIRGLLAERHADNGNYIDVISEAKSIYKYLPLADSLCRENPDFYLIVGLYNYFREKYPEIYPIYKPISIFFRSGDKARGLQQIETAARIGILTQAEAMTYLMEIYLHYEQKPARSLDYLRKLHKNYPGNTFYTARLAEAYVKLEDFDAAERLLAALFQSSSDYFQLYAHYLKGYIEERHYKRLQEAKKHYKQVLHYGHNFYEKGKLYKASSYLGLARIAEQRAKHAEAYNYYKAAYKSHSAEHILDQARRGMRRTEAQ